MRGSFIIHAMIDVPLVAVFMLQSHQSVFFPPAALGAAKHAGLQIKTLGFQLLLGGLRSVVREKFTRRL